MGIAPVRADAGVDRFTGAGERPPELDRASAARQRRLIDAYVRRHSGS